MTERQHVTVICGGRSVEHDISLLSANNVYHAIPSDLYQTKLFYISEKGQWFWVRKPDAFFQTSVQTEDQNHDERMRLRDGEATPITWVFGDESYCLTLESNPESITIGTVFPVLHGPGGEDGTLQGLLMMANVPFVGSGVLGSALSMDKDVTKRLLAQAGIAVVPWVTFDEKNKQSLNESAIRKTLGDHLFVKAASLGSSVGVYQVKPGEALLPVIEKAFAYDNKVIVESAMVGVRELEVAVFIGRVVASVGPGEVVVSQGFYDFEAKYIDKDVAVLKIPADVPQEVGQAIRAMAEKVALITACSGMARVDFFMLPNGKLVVNEVNTIPGFTAISLYPKLWEKAGRPNAKLVDDLIQEAGLEHQRRQKLWMGKPQLQTA